MILPLSLFFDILDPILYKICIYDSYSAVVWGLVAQGPVYMCERGVTSVNTRTELSEPHQPLMSASSTTAMNFLQMVAGTGKIKSLCIRIKRLKALFQKGV